MCKDLKDCLNAGRDEVETSKRQTRRRVRGRRGRPAGPPGHRHRHGQLSPEDPPAEPGPGRVGQQEEPGRGPGLEDPGKRGPGRSYPEPISLGDAKAHFALSTPTGGATILVHMPRATRLSKLFVTLNRTVEDHRTFPKRGPRGGGPSRQEPGEVSLKVRAEPQVNNMSDLERREKGVRC